VPVVNGHPRAGDSGRFEVPVVNGRPVVGESGRFDVPAANGHPRAGDSGRFDVPVVNGRPVAGESGRFDVPAPNGRPVSGRFDVPMVNGRPAAGDSGRFEVPMVNGRPVAGESGRFDVPAANGRPVAGRFEVGAPTGRPVGAGGQTSSDAPARGGRRPATTGSGAGGRFDTHESTDRIMPPRNRVGLTARDRAAETSVESIPPYREPAPAEPARRNRAAAPQKASRRSEPAPVETAPHHDTLAPRYSEPAPAVSASRHREPAAARAPRYSAATDPAPVSASRHREPVSTPRYRAAEPPAERATGYRASEPVTAVAFQEPIGELSSGARHRAGQPEPLSGRINAAESLPIDVTGQMALLDAHGHVRTPRDPYARADAAHDRLRLVPAITTAADPFERRPRHGRADDYDPEPVPVVQQRSGPEDSYDNMPPVRRSRRRA
jgi:hypothetical protein